MQFLANAGQVAASISAILALLGLIFFTPVRIKQRGPPNDQMDTNAGDGMERISIT